MSLSEMPSPPRPSDDPRPSQPPAKSPWRALLAWVPFVLSALWTAIVVRLVMRDMRYLFPLVVLALLWAVPLYVVHRRRRAALMRGSVPDVLEAWTPMLERTPYPETMQPILMATAYAANGWTVAAREAMARAHRGPAFEAAREQRLVVDTLCEAFDGNRRRAVRTAEELVELELPTTGMILRRRIAVMRQGLLAMARAFDRSERSDDRTLLLSARKGSPLFHWAFTYAAAVAALDAGDPANARSLLVGAPDWSPSSVFAEFHREIATEIARVEAIKSA